MNDEKTKERTNIDKLRNRRIVQVIVDVMQKEIFCIISHLSPAKIIFCFLSSSHGPLIS